MGFSRQEYWSGVPLPSLRTGLVIAYCRTNHHTFSTLKKDIFLTFWHPWVRNPVLCFKVSPRHQSRCQPGLGFHPKTHLGKGCSLAPGFFLKGWTESSPPFRLWLEAPSSLATWSPQHGGCFFKREIRMVCQQEMSHSSMRSVHRRTSVTVVMFHWLEARHRSHPESTGGNSSRILTLGGGEN